MSTTEPVHLETLPESRPLPCARLFAMSNTRQRLDLPCAQPTHTTNVRHTVYLAFGVCCTRQIPDTRQTQIFVVTP